MFFLQFSCNDTTLVRAMPNTPALMGTGATAYCCDRSIGPLQVICLHWYLIAPYTQAMIVERLFHTVGTCDRVASESQIDAVCGLSGSSCAYVRQRSYYGLPHHRFTW